MLTSICTYGSGLSVRTALSGRVNTCLRPTSSDPCAQRTATPETCQRPRQLTWVSNEPTFRDPKCEEFRNLERFVGRWPPRKNSRKKPCSTSSWAGTTAQPPRPPARIIINSRTKGRPVTFLRLFIAAFLLICAPAVVAAHGSGFFCGFGCFGGFLNRNQGTGCRIFETGRHSVLKT